MIVFNRIMTVPMYRGDKFFFKIVRVSVFGNEGCVVLKGLQY